MALGYGDRHGILGPEEIEGQTRCPIYRSGTFNVQRLTLNVKRGDRKGARWAGYGDRHGAWATGLLTAGPGRVPGGRSRPAAAPGYGDRHGVRTDQERSTSNVQLSTFNGVTEMAHGGRDMGTDTEFGRPGSCPGRPDQAPAVWSGPAVVPRYGDRHHVLYTDQERST